MSNKKYTIEERPQKYREVNLRYRQANKERIKARKREYYLQHKDEQKVIQHKCYEAHREERLRQVKLYYQAHKNDKKYQLKRRAYSKKHNRELKLEVLSYYSNGELKCARCPITDLDVLCIDHIHGGGGKHRKSISTGFIYWLKLNNYPSGYQVLCANCNLKKRIQEGEYFKSQLL